MKVEPIKSKDDIRNMLEILEYRNPRDKILFAIGIYTGLRISDILKLKVKDIYCKNRLEVKQQKTKEYVYIPINKELKKLIKEYVEDNNLAKYILHGALTTGQLNALFGYIMNILMAQIGRASCRERV